MDDPEDGIEHDIDELPYQSLREYVGSEEFKDSLAKAIAYNAALAFIRWRLNRKRKKKGFEAAVIHGLAVAIAQIVFLRVERERSDDG